MSIQVIDSVEELVNKLGYIPDGALELYLEGKNLIPPAGWTNEEHRLIASRYEAAQKAEADIRAANNRKTAWSYNLKKGR